MRGAFASARNRRRLTWLGVLALVGAGIAGLVLEVPAPKTPPEAKLTKAPVEEVATPKPQPFAPKKKQVIETAKRFIQTAVTRRDVGASWDLVAPSLKQGFTRKSWASGNELPVQSYPAELVTWHLAYSNSEEVDLQVALFKTKKQVRPQVFDMTLSPVRRNHRTRWLVSEFLPTPAEGGGLGGNPTPASLAAQQNAPHSPQIGKIWLLVPLSIFAVLLLTVATTLGVRSWRAGRLYREYARR